ncbi:MAG TPA: cytochrome c peroxidase [Chitinophagaceae bacterium]|nr:cytochrome c peroxidase [Chitinophagaceae bacterium]HUM65477.1 cytochrome c peroxidase [Chitinophagaceae bacterium]
MRHCLAISSLILVVFVSTSFIQDESMRLRNIYSRPPAQWPAPFVTEGVHWDELGELPAGPLQHRMDSLKHLIGLGKILFFDTRLSGSGKISCATCHQPELSWADGLEKSLGHEGTINKRNSPSLQNVWFYKKLFWDGRARDLEDQAFAPINSESEMHGDMRELPGKLRRIEAYKSLFDSAYGDPGIDPDRIAGAMAAFQRTIVSSPSSFDRFLAGEKKALSNSQLRGLHLFRTKAKCLNCHHGALFSDNQFHNNGFAGDDKGLYQVTHVEGDLGKFKTPSLRDVMKTAPWMHDGSQKNLMVIIEAYNEGKPATGKDVLLKPLGLTRQEKLDLLAFLHAISAEPLPFDKPVIP